MKKISALFSKNSKNTSDAPRISPVLGLNRHSSSPVRRQEAFEATQGNRRNDGASSSHRTQDAKEETDNLPMPEKADSPRQRRAGGFSRRKADPTLDDFLKFKEATTSKTPNNAEIVKENNKKSDVILNIMPAMKHYMDAGDAYGAISILVPTLEKIEAIKTGEVTDSQSLRKAIHKILKEYAHQDKGGSKEVSQAVISLFEFTQGKVEGINQENIDKAIVLFNKATKIPKKQVIVTDDEMEEMLNQARETRDAFLNKTFTPEFDKRMGRMFRRHR